MNPTGLAGAFFRDAASDADALIKEADKAIETAKQNAAKVGEAKAKVGEANKSQKADEATAKAFADLTKYLKENIEKILKDQKEGVTALGTQKQALEKMRKDLEALATKPAGTDEIVAKLKKKEGEVEAQSKASTDAAAALEAEAKKVYTTVDAMAKDLMRARLSSTSHPLATARGTVSV